MTPSDSASKAASATVAGEVRQTLVRRLGPSDGDHDAGYFERDRSPFLAWLAGRHGRVLEIGCGAGTNASWLRDHGAREIVGIEADVASAAKAADQFDLVFAEPVESALSKVDGEFDLILCLDVLEHLIDPWTVLEALHPFLRSGGQLAMSIPNVRFFMTVWSIAFGKGFRYAPEGILDVTHLRFFTRSDIGRMLRQTDWRPVRWGTPGKRFRTVRRVLRTATRGRSDEWLTVQWFVTAVPASVPRARSLGT